MRTPRLGEGADNDEDVTPAATYEEENDDAAAAAAGASAEEEVKAEEEEEEEEAHSDADADSNPDSEPDAEEEEDEDASALAGQKFYPAEEASSTDPLYGGYAAPVQASYSEPGGDGYYAPSTVTTPEQVAADVAAAANDDSAEPGDVAVDVTGDGVDADGDGVDGERGSRRGGAAAGGGKHGGDVNAEEGRSGIGEDEEEEEGKSRTLAGRARLHTRRWWERHFGRGGKRDGDGDGSGMGWRALLLQGAAALCVVVWLTSLIVGAILSRADGREDGRRASEEQRNLLG